MAGTFQGSVVFLTGASAGIGEAVAREFARQGARVALAARRAERLEALAGALRAAGGEALPVACDVTDRASLDAAVAQTLEAFGRIDVGIANAGFGVSGSALRLDTPDYRRQFETNVFGLIDTSYALLPALRESRGRLGLVGSVMGRLGLPASAPYCASKFAVNGFGESLYYDLAALGVSVTLINPGLVASELRSLNNQGEHTGKPDPAPQWLVMPAEAAARGIVRALARRAPEYTVTNHGKVAVFLARHFPRVTRFVIRKAATGRMEKIEQLKRGV
jgi:NADP-dependent 3-hydroxy acid dehydrogenase YdfG